MDDNWAALTVAIILGVPPETAFEMVDKGKSNISNNTRGRLYTDKDIEDMIELRKQCKLCEVAQMYDMSSSAVIHRIKRYQGR